MRNTKLITMIEGVIIAAIAVVLSFLPIQTGNAYFDLSLGLIPLGVYALRRGVGPGMAAGFLWGLLLILLGKAWFLSPIQVIIEYPVAFAFGGFGGIWAGKLRRHLLEDKAANPVRTAISGAALRTVILAGVTSAVTRWIFHFIAGVVFWGDTAPEGMNIFLFSFIGNGGSALANAIMLAVVLSILASKARTLFLPKDRLTVG
ncbi:energy-coupled thiamine transporter ThiT [Clostridia bacterium]|nr:energy-coupled thiamine transporter ThiT [Clostridia bacterium]